MRRTKIIATVGPATGKPGMLEKMLRAGVDLFRINYSHQSHADHEASVTQIRQISARLGIEVGIIADLQGPKILLERFRSGIHRTARRAHYLPATRGPGAARGGRGAGRGEITMSFLA